MTPERIAELRNLASGTNRCANDTHNRIAAGLLEALDALEQARKEADSWKENWGLEARNRVAALEGYDAERARAEKAEKALCVVGLALSRMSSGFALKGMAFAGEAQEICQEAARAVLEETKP